MPVEVAIVLAPTLAWAQDHWRELALATNLSLFSIAFERFVAQNASLTVNGEGVARHWYKQLLYNTFGIGTNNTCKDPESVNFINVLEIPQNDPNFVKVPQIIPYNFMVLTKALIAVGGRNGIGVQRDLCQGHFGSKMPSWGNEGPQPSSKVELIGFLVRQHHRRFGGIAKLLCVVPPPTLCAVTTYKSFAVIGGGRVGLPIATGLAAQNVSVILLSRSSTPTPLSGVPRVHADTSDVAAVTAVLKEHHVDVVISTINAGTPENPEAKYAAQKPVVDATKAAGVKLYLPSEFGCPQRRDSLGARINSQGFLEYAKSIGLPSVRIYTGIFTEIIPFLTGYGADGKIRVIGKGDTPVSFTSLSDIAGFVVHALTTLPPAALENRIFRLEGDRATSNELAVKFNTSVDHIDSVSGEGNELVAELRQYFEAGWGSSGWDEANKREVGEGAASGNASRPGHHWKARPSYSTVLAHDDAVRGLTQLPVNCVKSTHRLMYLVMSSCDFGRIYGGSGRVAYTRRTSWVANRKRAAESVCTYRS
ncbi:hypothetical protein B0H16DRAFT_1693769 [Mycena metata]|uniref:NmrA-like domain-containing protein n=1 Tax=Mycena metata TaxID=1033252 RepID=A0AAD7N1Q6_9AGAR|nr:hypothetical protein B0H16DRAFT_1693769 [Mycena metata]